MILTEPSIERPYRPMPLRQIFARGFRYFADRLDRDTIAGPTEEDLARAEAEHVRLSLAEAIDQQEKWAHTVQWLQAKLDRLQGGLALAKGPQ